MSRASELMFVMIDNARIMVNADKNVKNWLIKVTVMMVLFGILARVHMNVKSLVMLWILRLCECKCRKRLIHNLVEKCDEDIHRKEIIYNTTLCGYGRVGRSCTQYVVLLIKACIMTRAFLLACEKKLFQCMILLARRVYALLKHL